jgi:uncharacterized protein YchJ
MNIFNITKEIAKKIKAACEDSVFMQIENGWYFVLIVDSRC